MGAAGHAFADGARTVCHAVWALRADTLSDVRVIAYSKEEYETVQGITAEVRSD
ncbi:hypothetical protein [Halorientalis halophila]|uniref:hypothetical protein n=1 Tax=Halorientalis halophila TaxID=3108499 RepID=UPI00300999D1